MTFLIAGAATTVTYILSGAVIGYILYSFFIAKKRLNKPASEHVIVLDDENFDKTIGKGITLVDFWAEWCGPCKVQGPIIDEVADELTEKAKICKLDVDSNQKTARKLGIKNIPTLMLFKDGAMVQRFVGVKPKNVLIKAIKAQLIGQNG